MKLKVRAMTIVELTVVFFIIAVIVATATPSINRLYQESRLRRRASEAAAYFQQARQFAVTEQTTYGVYVYKTLNQFKMVHLVADPDNPGQFIENVESSFSVEEPLVISSSTIADGELLSFNSIGNPSKAGEVILTDDQERSRIICINAAGAVRLLIEGSCSGS